MGVNSTSALIGANQIQGEPTEGDLRQTAELQKRELARQRDIIDQLNANDVIRASEISDLHTQITNLRRDNANLEMQVKQAKEQNELLHKNQVQTTADKQ